ncbi:MFS general substrate transporter [Crepidotus variabilis]|uniref:MFS general substrate transporter n=1 Tax=Crepidotus variabilis TaxID=179855 RepID=A0A9P6EU48_9AGAR|nr:MFS general substrate transporter [Crepidotus variabilis]
MTRDTGHDNSFQETEQQPLLDSLILEDHEVQEQEHRNEVEKSLLKKVDRRMSILVLIYVLNYIDRNNVSAARLRGFEEDLHLEGSQFATILSVLYVGYIMMQIPSNIFLNHFGKPSKYLPICMVVWGGLSVATGFTTSYFGALFARFCLGFVEAAFFPGALFLISKWYKRSELSQRMALLTSGNLISNAFGSLIASGILDSMHGVWGYQAWRWLFFVEGGLTIVVAFWSMSLLPDFPETSSGWLTPEEKALAVRRMAEDAGHYGNMDETVDKSKLLSRWPGLHLAVMDWKVWYMALNLTFICISLSFHAYFPTLAATLGYSPTISLLLCAPPWLMATGVTITLSRHSDNMQERCKHICFSLFLGIFGFVLAMTSMNFTIRYISLFFMAQMYGAFMCFLAWASGTVSYPPAKRAVALALINCVSQSGNVFGSYVWPSSWGPTYNISYTICAFMAAIGMVMCVAFRLHLDYLNRMGDNLESRERGLKTYRYML